MVHYTPKGRVGATPESELLLWQDMIYYIKFRVADRKGETDG